MTAKQNQIAQLIYQEGGAMKLKAIVAHLSWQYHANAYKHIYNRCKRMIDIGYLEKAGHGMYRVRGMEPRKDQPVPNGQLEINF